MWSCRCLLCDRVEQKLKNADYDADETVLNDEKVFYKNRSDSTVEWICFICESKMSKMFKPRDQFVDKRLAAMESTLSANAVGMQNVYDKFLAFEARFDKLMKGKSAGRSQPNTNGWSHGMDVRPKEGQQVLFNKVGLKTHCGVFNQGYFHTGDQAKHTLDCYWMPLPELIVNG